MSYVANIEKETLENENFRKVLYTAPHSQLVVMSLQPKEEIGEEIHKVDQFLRIEFGRGKSVLDGKEYDISVNSIVYVPSGTRHNIINTSESEKMKLYTIYSPAQHKDGTIHKTKADAAEE